MIWTAKETERLLTLKSNGWSHKEIAKKLGKTKGAVTGRLRNVAKASREKEVEPKVVRKLESKVARLTEDLKLQKKMREEAEHELASTSGELDSLLSVNDKLVARKIKKTQTEKGTSTAILCANDWHAEAIVDKGVVSGVNEFNLEIAQRRIDRLWKKGAYLVNFTRHISDIRELVLWLGGDLISGSIHEELEESNTLGPAEAIIFVLENILGGVEYLLKNSGVETIRVVTSYGNHARTTKKKRHATGYRHNWEWLLYRNLEKRLAHYPNVTVSVTNGYFNYQAIQGHTVRFHHGDSIKFGGGVGGITIPVRKRIAQWNKTRRANFDVFGHFHQLVDGWDFVSCGCLVGYDAFAESIAADYQFPTQTFIVLDRQYGKILTAPVFVEEVV